MNTPILSIIIPTNNRHQYASVIIRTILKNFTNTELIVSDVSINNTLEEEFRNNIDNERFKYVKQEAGLDMTNNFERALKLATGDYIVFIGDDDGVYLDIEKVAHWAKANKIDSIYTTTPATYYWKGFYSVSYGNKLSEAMLIHKFTGNICEINAKGQLQESLKDLGSGLKKMPRIYHGMASRTICQKIINKYGNLFGGISPDIYSASLISVESEKAVLIDFPVIIPGSSPKSGAGLGASHTHIGTFRESPHIKAFKNLEWDKRIPAFYSVQTVFGSSSLKACEKINKPEYRINFLKLYAKCLMHHRKYRYQTMEALKIYSLNQSKNRISINLFFLKCEDAYDFIKLVLNRLIYSKLGVRRKVVKNIENMQVAMEELQKIVKERNIHIFYNDEKIK